MHMIAMISKSRWSTSQLIHYQYHQYRQHGQDVEKQQITTVTDTFPSRLLSLETS